MEAEKHPLRTIKQHRTEWMYYQIISNYTGHTPYEVYNNIAGRILKVVCDDGEQGYIRPASLDPTQHNLYMEQVRVFAAEYGIILPDPETEDIFKHEYKKQKTNGRK